MQTHIKTIEEKEQIINFRQEKNVELCSKYEAFSSMDYFVHVVIAKAINAMVCPGI